VLETLHLYLTHWLAPILVFTAEEAWLARSSHSESLHYNLYPDVPEDGREPVNNAKWSAILDIRKSINQALTDFQVVETIKNKSELSALVKVNEHIYNLVDEVNFAELTGFSEVKFSLQTESVPQDVDSIRVIVSISSGRKCPRCWISFVGDGEFCSRCESVMFEAKEDVFAGVEYLRISV